MIRGGGTMWTVRLALVNSTGFSLTTILPLWIAALPTVLHVAPWQVGLLGTLQLATCGMCNIAAPWLAPRSAELTVARMALSIAVLGCLCEGLALSVGDKSLVLFGLAAMLSGAAFGVLLAMTNRIMAGSDHAQHGYAIFQIVEVCFASAVFVTGAILVRGSGSMLFMASAAICLLGLAALHRLPDPNLTLHKSQTHAPSSKLGGFLMLGSMLCFFSGQSSINSFLIPIGARSGLDDQTVAHIVGAGMVFALGGATMARVLGERFGTIVPLITVGMLMAFDFVLITAPAPPLGFAIGAALIPSGTIFVVPYFFTALARADREGRFASLGPAFLIGGVSLGPLIAGLLGNGMGYARLGWTSALLVSIGVGVASLGGRIPAIRSVSHPI